MDLIEYRKTVDTIDDRRGRLLKFVRDAITAGHNPWRAKHRFKGTYGNYPPAAWIMDAIYEVKTGVNAWRRQTA